MRLPNEVIAEVCHEGNRVLQKQNGEEVSPPWDLAPEWMRDSSLEGVIAIWEGRVLRPEDSHSNWSKTRKADGWVYGPEKSEENKTHPCLVPYAELPHSQRMKDALFLAIASTLLTA